MPAYLMSEVKIIDQTLAERYRALTANSVTAYGGEYLARGVTPEAVEGQWPADQYVVLVRFPDLAAVRAWYASAGYAEALALSRDALSRRLLVFEGHVPSQED
jgi:uncharacterized protein (DUF1330 family)